MPVLCRISKFTHLGNSLVQLSNAINVGIQTGSCVVMPSIGTDQETFDILKDVPDKDFSSGVCGEEQVSKFFFQNECLGVDEPSNKDRREILHKYVLDHIRLDDTRQVKDETLVIHIRSGDIFGGWIHKNYIQPPLSYYKKIIKEHGNEDVLILTQKDKSNPCVDALLSWDNDISIQTGTLRQDMTSILMAKNLVIGFGTFGWMISLLSKNINRLYTPDVNQDLFSSYFMQPPFNIKRYQFEDYIGVGEWNNSEAQRHMMISHPETKIGEMNALEY
jgi:hypothetical protein